jgi:hypothetical protein
MEINGNNKFSEWAKTTTFNYEISTMWKTMPRTNPRKTSRMLMGLE